MCVRRCCGGKGGEQPCRVHIIPAPLGERVVAVVAVVGGGDQPIFEFHIKILMTFRVGSTLKANNIDWVCFAPLEAFRVRPCLWSHLVRSLQLSEWEQGRTSFFPELCSLGMPKRAQRRYSRSWESVGMLCVGVRFVGAI